MTSAQFKALPAYQQNLGALRAESTEWELQVSRAVEKDEELAATVRRLEEAYDDELLRSEAGES